MPLEPFSEAFQPGYDRFDAGKVPYLRIYQQPELATQNDGRITQPHHASFAIADRARQQ